MSTGDVANLTGLEKPLVKLIETVSEGVGVVGNHFFGFDVAKIKRTGEAEAEVEKTKIIARAEAQQEALAVLGRAEKRFALEQYTKQINLENIIVRSREDLRGKEVSDEPVEKDWTMRFLDIAQNVSREELQEVLAKILSGEIQRPGSFSYQTLEVIRCLSARNLEMFQRFVALSTEAGMIKVDSTGEFLEKFGLSFGMYLELGSLGIFNQSSTIGYNVKLSSGETLSLQFGKELLILKNNSEATKTFDQGLYVFSVAGREIAGLMREGATNEHFETYKGDLIRKIQEAGFEVISK